MGVCINLLCSSSVCITSLLDMTINLQLIMKNHPVIRIRISKAKVVKPNVRLIMIESKKSKADIYVRSYRERFGLCNYDSLFFCCLFTLVLSCLYFLCKWNYFGLDLPTPGYHCKKISYSYSYAYQRHLLCSCRLL